MDNRWRRRLNWFLTKKILTRVNFLQTQRQQLLFFLVIFILGIGAFVRYSGVTTNPPVLNPDEASVAYNALLLYQTGKDEWRQSWPLVLQAFGDQKIAGYTYLVVAVFGAVGVSELAVRLPAVVSGVLLIGVAGILLRSLTRNSNKHDPVHTDEISSQTWLLTMALIALQPVFIWYSRVAFEAMPALVFTLVLVWLLYRRSKYSLVESLAENNVHKRVMMRWLNMRCLNIRWLNMPWLHKRRLNMPWLNIPWLNPGSLAQILGAALVAVGAVFLYNVPLILLPFLVAPVIFWYGVRRWQVWLPVVATLAIVWVGLVWGLQGLTEQKSHITIFGDPTVAHEQLEYYQSFENTFQQRLLGNRYVFYARLMFERFFASFHTSFLFENKGGHPWHALPGTGYITFWTYWFGWLGILSTIWIVSRKIFRAYSKLQAVLSDQTTGTEEFKSAIEKIGRVFAVYRVRLLFLYITFISLLPSIITVNAPHATRTLLFFVGWCYLASLGVLVFFEIVRVLTAWLFQTSLQIGGYSARTILYQLIVVAVSGIIAYPSGVYVHSLLMIPVEEQNWSSDLQVWLPPAIESIEKAQSPEANGKIEIETDDDLIRVLDPRGFSYILVAWYTRMEPTVFWSTLQRSEPDTINFTYGERVGKYRFVRSLDDKYSP
jgi:4-amino-4-deoxy-L-arabinose transferase-like glycosyltransferase